MCTVALNWAAFPIWGRSQAFYFSSHQQSMLPFLAHIGPMTQTVLRAPKNINVLRIPCGELPLSETRCRQRKLKPNFPGGAACSYSLLDWRTPVLEWILPRSSPWDKDWDAGNLLGRWSQEIAINKWKSKMWKGEKPTLRYVDGPVTVMGNWAPSWET